MNNTLSTQPLTQNPPIYFPQNPPLKNQNPPSSLPIPPNPFNSQPPTSNLPSTSYNRYVSLHPGFQNFPTNSFQPPNIPPNPLPPSTSTLLNEYISKNEYPSTINLKCNAIFTRGLPINAKLNTFQVPMNLQFLLTLLLRWLILKTSHLKKIKTQELSLEINNLSNTFQQNTTIQDSPPKPPQNQAVDPNVKSKPQFRKYCSFCHKNNHSVPTCFRRLNML